MLTLLQSFRFPEQIRTNYLIVGTASVSIFIWWFYRKQISDYQKITHISVGPKGLSLLEHGLKWGRISWRALGKLSLNDHGVIVACYNKGSRINRWPDGFSLDEDWSEFDIIIPIPDTLSAEEWFKIIKKFQKKHSPKARKIRLP